MIALIALLLASTGSFPPAAPGKDESPLNAISDPEVQRCGATQGKILQELRWRTIRVLTTTSPKYGQLWRADVATDVKPPIITRLVCSKRRATMNPLEMFDPKESLAPLP